MSVKGIDLSTFQTNVNWEKVKADGIEFAMVRAGFGNSITQKDNMFDSHVTGALKAGIAVGAYWFSYAISTVDAEQEARVFQQVLNPYKGQIAYPTAFNP